MVESRTSNAAVAGSNPVSCTIHKNTSKWTRILTIEVKDAGSNPVSNIKNFLTDWVNLKMALEMDIVIGTVLILISMIMFCLGFGCGDFGYNSFSKETIRESLTRFCIGIFFFSISIFSFLSALKIVFK